ncbi:heme o synthase [Nitratireductor pacificus]|uniref:Protoheme IX farnesyltransferase n=1 Tax=Nitratireductor pacificus pht-3B TaxID=391937 RepID=K2LQ50_9HYPH|nr:heme o synthase [Nitratireductor pacificus]EKF19874.1 protoheme IX farnesyltransferase [Nitratireductor pacificus pht-3B]
MALVEQEHMNEAGYRLSEASPGDFIALLKPRVMSLVVFTAFVGMAMAPGVPNPLLAMIAIAAIAVGAGASGALNMWYDADIDAVMGRTKSRPVPAGLVTPGEALAFGLVLSALSVVTLGLLANLVAGALLAFTIFFYAVVYTIWLKRSTPQNIVIGGAAGALPPVVGWAAVTGTVSIESLILFLIIFLWTPPHFWALALFKSADYERAGIPMLPNVAGHAATKTQIFVYAVLLALSGLLPVWAGFAGLAYGAVATVLGAGFLWYAWRVLRMPEGDQAMKPAKSLFAYSLLYLFVLFTALLAERLAAGLGFGG